MVKVASEQIGTEESSDIEVVKVLELLLEHFVYMQGVHGNQRKVKKDVHVLVDIECV